MTYKLDPFQRIFELPGTYILTRDLPYINEGQTVTYTVNTDRISTGTVLYWNLESISGNITNSDFSLPASAVTVGGSITIINSSATFTVTASNDITTEGTETFRAVLRREYPSTGTVVATSLNTIIYDTSISPAPEPNTASFITSADPLFFNNPAANLNKTLHSVRWNHNGTSFAIAHDRDDNNNSISIYNRSGSSATKIASILSPTDGTYYHDGMSVDWNYDGTLLACSFYGSINRIYKRTGNSFTLTWNSTYSGSPRFHKTQNLLAIHSWTGGDLVSFTVSSVGTVSSPLNYSRIYNGITFDIQNYAWHPTLPYIAGTISNTSAFDLMPSGGIVWSSSNSYSFLPNWPIGVHTSGAYYNKKLQPEDVNWTPDGNYLYVGIFGEGINTGSASDSQGGLLIYQRAGTTYSLGSRPFLESGIDPANRELGWCSSAELSSTGKMFYQGYGDARVMNYSGLSFSINQPLTSYFGTKPWYSPGAGYLVIGNMLFAGTNNDDQVVWNPQGTSIIQLVKNDFNAPGLPSFTVIRGFYIFDIN